MVGSRLGYYRPVTASIVDFGDSCDGILSLRHTIDDTSVAAVQIVWLMSCLFWQSELQGVIESQSLSLTASKNVDPAKKMTHKMVIRDVGNLRVVRFVEDGCVIGSLKQDSILALHSVFDVGTA